MKELSLAHIKSFYKLRESNSHKGTHGHALIVAGNHCRMGATIIAVKACIRSGIGLLTVNIPYSERLILQISIPEAMITKREDLNSGLSIYSSIGIGPGIGLDRQSKNILMQILCKSNCPIILDADALTIISEDKTSYSKIPKGTVLTPHPKEFDRLFGSHSTTEERVMTAKMKAKELEIIIVLKGPKTVITSGDESFENTTGNAGLAKAGSGDALTGIITALLSQNYNSFEAAKLGVFLHGIAADITLNQQSMESMIITDVIEFLGDAFKTLTPEN